MDQIAEEMAQSKRKCFRYLADVCILNWGLQCPLSVACQAIYYGGKQIDLGSVPAAIQQELKEAVAQCKENDAEASEEEEGVGEGEEQEEG